MGDAGVAKEIPVVALDRALVADGQRGQHAGGASVGDFGVDPVAHALAQTLDRKARAFGQQTGWRRVAHIAGGAHALLEQQQLVVEAVRIEIAVRPAQPHREAPALAGAQLALRLGQGRVFVKAAVPAERDPRGTGAALAARTGSTANRKRRPPGPAAAGWRRRRSRHVATFELGRQRIANRSSACQPETAKPARPQRAPRAERCAMAYVAPTQAPTNSAAAAAVKPTYVDGGHNERSCSCWRRRPATPAAARRAARRWPVLASGKCRGPGCTICPLRACGPPMSSIYDRLTDLDISLPPLAIPAGAYVPFVRSGNLVFLSGHIAKRDGKAWVGQLGRDMTTSTGRKAARAVAVDLLGTLHAAVGDLDKVERIVRITSLVNSAPDFIEHHLVTNGCSELLGEIFAEKGAHARSAYGVAQLPLGACVEIELIAQVAE